MRWEEASGNQLAVEIRNANLTAAEWSGRNLTLRPAEASLFRSEGRPGFDPGTVWRESFRVHLEDARVAGMVSVLPVVLMNGTLQVDTLKIENCIPIGQVWHDRIEVGFLSIKGGEWIIRASRFEIEPLDEPEWIDIWPGA